MNTKTSFKEGVLYILFVIVIIMTSLNMSKINKELKSQKKTIEILSLQQEVLLQNDTLTTELVGRMKTIQEFHLENTEPHMKGL